MVAQLEFILIVDGDEQFAGDIAAGLRARKAEVEIVTSAEAMVEAVERRRPQMILLSVELPKSKGAGYLACNKLKKDSDKATIPVILMSATATEEDFAKHRKLATHADDYIRKPFSDDEFFRKVGNVLGFEISKGDFEQLQEKVHDFLGEKADLEANIRQKAEIIAQLEEKVSQLQDQLVQKRQAENGQLQIQSERLLQLQADVGVAEKKLEESRQVHLGVQDKVSELQDRIAQLGNERRSLEESVGELAEQKAVLEAEIELLQGQKQESVLAVDQAQAKHLSLVNDINGLDAAKARLSQTIESSRRQLAETAKVAREVAESLESAMAGL